MTAWTIGLIVLVCWLIAIGGIRIALSVMSKRAMKSISDEAINRSPYLWLEVKMRSRRDGMHDSGYRFIQVTGVSREEDSIELIRTSLHQWADHLTLYGVANIDFTEDGVMRVMCYDHAGGWVSQGWTEGSDAEFRSADVERSARLMKTMDDVYKKSGM